MSNTSNNLPHNIEFEAKFYWVNKSQLQQKLLEKGAKLAKPESLFKIIIYNFDEKILIPKGYLRLRDEAGKVTLSIKVSASADGKMSDQKEINTVVASFEGTKYLLENLGYTIYSYREKYRETWEINNAEVVIDTVPGLPVYCEVESSSEELVWETAKVLELDKLNHTFAGADELYIQEYRLSEEEFSSTTSVLTFSEYPNWLKLR